MARPIGRYNWNVNRTEGLLLSLGPVVRASNQWLAQKLRCSIRQVQRYLKTLEMDQKFTKEIRRGWYWDYGWKSKRKIMKYIPKPKPVGYLGKFGKPNYDFQNLPEHLQEPEALERLTGEITAAFEGMVDHKKILAEYEKINPRFERARLRRLARFITSK